jgi:hypothetical protein
LLGYLIKECTHNDASKERLAESMKSICAVIIKSIQTADSWKKKKVTKTIQVVNLYTKAAKILAHKGTANAVSTLREQGLLIIKAIEAEC